MIDFRLYKSLLAMTSGECFVSPPSWKGVGVVGGLTDWKLVFDNPRSKINKVQDAGVDVKGLMGVRRYGDKL